MELTETFNVMNKKYFDKLNKDNQVQREKKKRALCIRIIAENGLLINYSLLTISLILMIFTILQCASYSKIKKKSLDATKTLNAISLEYRDIKKQNVKISHLNVRINAQYNLLKKDFENYQNKVGKQEEQINSINDKLKNSILSNLNYFQTLESYLNPMGKTLGHLCFSSLIHGDNPYIFHENCKLITPTVVLYKADKIDAVFGGYTQLSWNLDLGDSLTEDKTSFLFSLTNKKKFKFEQGKCNFSIIIIQNCYPSFGANDLLCGPGVCKSTFPRCFGSGERIEDFVPSSNFPISSVEVYSVVDK